MTLRKDAIAIWKAAVAAVDSESLIRRHLRIDGDQLLIGTESVDLAGLKHIEVVGAGKAGTGMARGVEVSLQDLPGRVSVSGWVNVPEDCVERLEQITLHAARPAGINEPTAAGVRGTQEILRRVAALSKDDLCLVLISGGGSALLPAPVPGISLDDKLTVTRRLASAGAPIQDLNCVRSRLSGVKGGGLARACRAGRLITLIISDVIGDPLDVIASGPTVAGQTTISDALDVLRNYDPELLNTPLSVRQHLERAATANESSKPVSQVSNQIIGNNRTALDAAAVESARRGYRVVDLGSENCGEAAQLGDSLFKRLSGLAQANDERVCLLAGGETTVQLAPTSQPRRGGRNQELVLAAIAAHPSVEEWRNLALLSGGTDGEDGPTPAAGAVADVEFVRRMLETRLDANAFLAINNSYPFFEQLHGLLLTGPTHTNVMDVQVGVVG